MGAEPEGLKAFERLLGPYLPVLFEINWSLKDHLHLVLKQE